MRLGQRPRQHVRRVRTNSGRKPTTINKGVKFKSYATPKYNSSCSNSYVSKLLDRREALISEYANDLGANVPMSEYKKEINKIDSEIKNITECKPKNNKRLVATTRTFLEAAAIKKGSDDLNIKLGKRNRAVLKRKGTNIEVWV